MLLIFDMHRARALSAEVKRAWRCTRGRCLPLQRVLDEDAGDKASLDTSATLHKGFPDANRNLLFFLLLFEEEMWVLRFNKHFLTVNCWIE